MIKNTAYGESFADPGAFVHRQRRHLAIEGGALRRIRHGQRFFKEGIESGIGETGAVAGADVAGVKELQEVFGIGIITDPGEAEQLESFLPEFFKKTGFGIQHRNHIYPQFAPVVDGKFPHLTVSGIVAALVKGQGQRFAGGGVDATGESGFGKQFFSAFQIVFEIGIAEFRIVSGNVGRND